MRQKLWTKKEYDVLRKKYSTLGPKNLSPVLNRGWRSIYDAAQRLGLKMMESHKYDRNLKKPDISQFIEKNPRSVYILGFIWADGYIQKKKKRTAYAISLSLLQKDFEKIEPILESTGEWKIYSKKSGERNSAAKIGVLISKSLYDYLTDMDFQIKSVTSPTKILNEIPENLKHYFWRGYFDGDGYVNSKNSSKSMIFTGSFNQNWTDLIKLLNKLGIKNKTIKINGINSKCSRVVSFTSRDVVKFYEYIYQGKIFGLNRKRARFIEIKKSLTNPFHPRNILT